MAICSISSCYDAYSPVHPNSRCPSPKSDIHPSVGARHFRRKVFFLPGSFPLRIGSGASPSYYELTTDGVNPDSSCARHPSPKSDIHPSVFIFSSRVGFGGGWEGVAPVRSLAESFELDSNRSRPAVTPRLCENDLRGLTDLGGLGYDQHALGGGVELESNCSRLAITPRHRARRLQAAIAHFGDTSRRSRRFQSPKQPTGGKTCTLTT